ncbi:MAG: hypothetical protein J2P54_14955 [Bradyrhizobiaceae bacterium]|nr:hypothetical protein [Bradyrhizobiaceae bacterium]
MAREEENHPAVGTAWNPGLESELLRVDLPLSTIFRTENVSTSVDEAHELSDYCGLPVQDIVAFRADRLVVHELLTRVTAGIAVPDGADYEDLGNNFRAIASTVLNKYVLPHRDELAQVLERLRGEASAAIRTELAASLFANPAPAGKGDREGRRSGLFGFGRPKQQPMVHAQTAEQREQRIISNWSKKAETAETRLDQSCFAALSRIATAIMSRRGRLLADKELLTKLATTYVCNDYGSELIGDAIVPYFLEAAAREGYRLLAPKAKPVVMNIKGASASGKSSMRPLQKNLAKKLGQPWEDFAVISPDIWRKFLLDYGATGRAYKYAAMLTGHELEIIDRKLDRHMAMKAARGEMPHLLIDRFRFDSFVPDASESLRLLTRFGELVYMFFMITPPEMTVERAWKRGLQVGRFKAVEDLLAHNVEAYTGMPELFFTWALDTRRRVHYEFLDNSVDEGHPPRTVAYGWNREMTILDIKRILDIDRFRKINIHARGPDEVYFDKELPAERNVGFMKRCVRLIPTINFADYKTGRVYARLEHGSWAWRDEEQFARSLEDPDDRAGLSVIIAKGDSTAGEVPDVFANLEDDKLHTLGAWGHLTTAP